MDMVSLVAPMLSRNQQIIDEMNTPDTTDRWAEESVRIFNTTPTLA